MSTPEVSELPPPFPAVQRDAATEAFFDAAGRGELLVQQCAGCGTVLTPEAKTCFSCGSVELGPTVVSGRGRLITWVVVSHPPVPVLAGAVPYVTAVVELDEGPWLMVRLIDADPEVLTAGDSVQVDFVRSGAGENTGEMLPVFRRVGSADKAEDKAGDKATEEKA
ncbi:Zn-ribbon domain-containing OB-fold protein [Sporichthya polymorpha]|uniref:Zn-ribbon domain-containing OB-fold protein n=1 Tax=Sporichthya polymorpha TaxID=35751 RepID=UPI0003772071|nr:OB-fold domain-containing protein [Sporichthya polymorpha]